ncbi:hypothetical protein E1301_Tti006992 [Triplophysa tibetana]|uniref:Uncharacterized protein n=1 Tax=Triplophysa tibetana TaxID=1572043 RepID=A0A5A9N2G4_9TELE|nr:hypothetical protein E1301_Tti006992 [Triplophysa tibetana]
MFFFDDAKWLHAQTAKLKTDTNQFFSKCKLPGVRRDRETEEKRVEERRDRGIMALFPLCVFILTLTCTNFDLVNAARHAVHWNSSNLLNRSRLAVCFGHTFSKGQQEVIDFPEPPFDLLSDSQILKRIQLPNAVEYRCGLNYNQIEHMHCSWGLYYEARHRSCTVTLYLNAVDQTKRTGLGSVLTRGCDAVQLNVFVSSSTRLV